MLVFKGDLGRPGKRVKTRTDGGVDGTGPGPGGLGARIGHFIGVFKGFLAGSGPGLAGWLEARG